MKVVEIACPNCHARYQVPAEALGSAGREVACSSCGTVWLARAAPEPAPAEPLRPQPVSEQPAPSQPQAAPPPPQQGGERGQQMAEIRQMLDEVQSAERQRAAVPPAPEGQHATERWGERTAPVADQGRPRRRDAYDDEDRLRSSLGQSDTGRRGRGGDGEQSRDRLMKRHGRRYRESQAAEKRRSGAGYTGFLLVVLVSAVLVGLYALHPQIIARAPETEPALRNYVAAVEEAREQLAAGYEEVAGMINDRIAEAGGE